MPTPAENLATVLRVTAAESDYVRRAAVLAGYAESDYQSDAVQRETVGVFQQNPRWWPSATQSTEAQCRAFVAAFKAESRRWTGDLVRDCWLVQRWEVPGSAWPDPGPDFATSPETVNYSHRVAAVADIIRTGRLP